MSDGENNQPLYWEFGNSLGYVGELESARDDLQRAIQLRNAFSAALADIRDSWSKKDADNKN